MKEQRREETEPKAKRTGRDGLDGSEAGEFTDDLRTNRATPPPEPEPDDDRG